MPLEKKLSAEVSAEVTEEMTARAIGSGEVAGLATPEMVALMEVAAVKAVEGHLDEGMSTVGTHVNVAHSAPTPVGMRITAEAVLVDIVGRQLVFEVSAHDEVGEIGKGTHSRFLVTLRSFEERIAGRGRPKA